jgi:ATP-dependent DNA ligase
MGKKTAFPTLYHRGKGGSLVQWNIWVEDDTIFTEHGQVGGKLQTTPGIICESKNVGRSNETTPEEQAFSEAKAMWTFKIERKYSETMEDALEEVFLPMLADNFKKISPKKKASITYPVDVQPKLDGVRAMAFWDEDRVVLFTRGGKEWKAPQHIIKELESIMPREMVLDGELYIHGVDFESLTSWAKKIHPETADLEYHVFDMPISALGQRAPWKTRRDNLVYFFAVHHVAKKIVMVPIVSKVANEKEILALEEKFVEEGYEGAVVRESSGEYLFGHRSSFLLKVKSSQDADYKIVDFTHGKGSHAEAVKWICKTPAGLTFEVNPKAPMKVKKQLYKDGKKHIGKWIKVQFQNYTVDNKPRFGRSLGFRDKIDMS